MGEGAPHDEAGCEINRIDDLAWASKSYIRSAVRIVWDEPKRGSNLAKHGLDFASLTVEFFEGSLVVPVKKGRWKAIGRLADGTIVVIFATLGAEAFSVISMRPASASERRMLR